jgi:multisubunit Na+/H+ antiporter MnhC subunit
MKMQKRFIKPMNKRGQGGGLVTGLVFGIASLIIGVIIAFVLITTITGAGLLTSGSAEDNAVDALSTNFSKGVDSVASKVPTILLVAAIVLIIGVLAVLVGVWQRMRMGGGQL